MNREKQIHGTRFSALGRNDSSRDTLRPHRFNIGCLITHVHEPDRLRLVAASLQFDELSVIDPDVGHERFAGISEFESLLEAKGSMKGSGPLHIGHSKRHVSNPRPILWRRRSSRCTHTNARKSHPCDSRVRAMRLNSHVSRSLQPLHTQPIAHVESKKRTAYFAAGAYGGS